MNELVNIKNENGELLVSARELYEGLGNKERFSKWFDRMISYGFEENIDYTPYQMVHPQNKQEITDYVLKIDCAKEICMLQKSEKGREFRKYFIECEKRLKEGQLQLTKKQELQLLILNGTELERVASLKEYENLVVSEATVPLLNKIEEDKPLVTFAEQILKDGDNILVRELAKLASDHLNIKIGEKNLYRKLREWKYICNGSTEPSQMGMNLEYFVVETRVINTPYGSRQVFTTFVTPKGQVKIVEKLRKEFCN